MISCFVLFLGNTLVSGFMCAFMSYYLAIGIIVIWLIVPFVVRKKFVRFPNDLPKGTFLLSTVEFDWEVLRSIGEVSFNWGGLGTSIFQVRNGVDLLLDTRVLKIQISK